jgi:hypothetical protein
VLFLGDEKRRMKLDNNTAQKIKWCVAGGCTWRKIAELFADSEMSGNQLEGKELCETAAQVLGEDIHKYPWEYDIKVLELGHVYKYTTLALVHDNPASWVRDYMFNRIRMDSDTLGIPLITLLEEYSNNL